jgi:hypothetical protein
MLGAPGQVGRGIGVSGVRRSGGAPVPTAMPQSAHIVARFDASTLALNNNDPVSTWTDSINGIQATEATKQPVFKTNAYGGKPVVSFNGTHRMVIASTGAIGTALDSRTNTVLYVARNTGTSGGNGRAWNVEGIYFHIIDNDGSGNRYQDYSQSYLGRGAPIALNEFHVFGATYSASPARSRACINGTIFNTDATPPAAANGAAVVFGNNAAGNAGAKIDMAEIIIFDVVLTPAELIQANMSLCEKYAQPYPFAALPYFLVFDGDSMTANINYGSVQAGPAYQTAQALSLPWGAWTNNGIGSISTTVMTTNAPSYIDGIPALVGKPTKLMEGEWYNESGTGTQKHDASVTYLLARRAAGFKTCFWTNIDPDGVDAASRTDYNTQFDAVNAPTYMDSYVPVHLNEFIGLDGARTAYPANFYADNIHLNAAGGAVIYPLWVAGLNAIP